VGKGRGGGGRHWKVSQRVFAEPPPLGRQVKQAPWAPPHTSRAFRFASALQGLAPPRCCPWPLFHSTWELPSSACSSPSTSCWQQTQTPRWFTREVGWAGLAGLGTKLLCAALGFQNWERFLKRVAFFSPPRPAPACHRSAWRGCSGGGSGQPAPAASLPQRLLGHQQAARKPVPGAAPGQAVWAAARAPAAGHPQF
jgi:hypothetical protein